MSQLAKERGNLQNTRRVTQIQFGLMNPKDIERASVVEVTKPETYSGNEPVANGLLDTRMGVLERGPLCNTCGNNSVLCPGHMGHIKLAKPVFYVHMIDIVVKLLYCVCFRCSTLLVDKKKIKNLRGKRGEERFKAIHSASAKNQKSSRCCQNVGCGFVQPAKYNYVSLDKARGADKENVASIFAEFKEEAIRDPSVSPKQKLTPEHCYNIFRRISDNDVTFLGFHPAYSRPEWFICRVLPVPPPSMRPSVQREAGQRMEDDLTHVLIAIIKANNQLKLYLKKNEAEAKINAMYNNLQYNITTLIDNKSSGIPSNIQRSGKPIKSVCQRINGKEGRLRGNAQGKRVDFSARTVVTVDPTIRIDEVGVPKKIAMILTRPEVVTKYNIEDMYELVRNGPTVYPGAKRIERMEYDCYNNPAPCTISLKHVDPSTVSLKIGDRIHRHLQNGDPVLFNRQPTLHRMNMMIHEAKIVEGNTFRLNVFTCKPYNKSLL